MTDVVYKYKIGAGYDHRVVMPRAAKILHVGIQRGVVCLWAQVTLPDLIGRQEITPEVETREFVVFGTGYAFKYAQWHTYIGTVRFRPDQVDEQVFHVYEVNREETTDTSSPAAGSDTSRQAGPASEQHGSVARGDT